MIAAGVLMAAAHAVAVRVEEPCQVALLLQIILIRIESIASRVVLPLLLILLQEISLRLAVRGAVLIVLEVGVVVVHVAMAVTALEVSL